MNRRRFVPGGIAAVLLVSAAIFAPAPATAAPYRDGPFTALRSELRHRAENDFGGDLSPEEKKQQKAVTKALATLDKTSKNFGVDLKNAGKIAKSLQAAYAGEFAGPMAMANLREVVDFMFNDLHALCEGDLADQEGRDDALSEKGAAKVDALQGAATNALESGRNTAYADWTKAMIAAYKAWLKAEKVIARDKGPGGPSGKQFLKGTINGAKWESDADTRVATYNNVGGLVVISGTKIGLPAKFVSVAPQAPVSGTGTYTISVGQYNELGLPTKSYQVTNGGTITFTVFDTVNQRMAGTFSFTATGVSGTTGSVTVEGSFDLIYVNAGV